MKLLWIGLILLCLLNANAQTSTVNVGIEQDVLPYIFKGYFANAWIGKGHMRSRFLLATLNKPDFLLKKPFTNNRVSAYAVTADYFRDTDWRGWWAATGIVLWKNSLQTDALLETKHFNTWLLNGSLGYSWRLGRHFYFGPWAGIHFRIGGKQNVIVDGEKYSTPLLNPEGSLKAGWIF